MVDHRRSPLHVRSCQKFARPAEQRLAQAFSATRRRCARAEGQAARYFLGPIAGGSKILLETDFIGPDGTLLAQVRGEGTVSGGFFGGSNKSGIDQAVDKIAEFAAANFKQ